MKNIIIVVPDVQFQVLQEESGIRLKLISSKEAQTEKGLKDL